MTTWRTVRSVAWLLGLAQLCACSSKPNNPPAQYPAQQYPQQYPQQQYPQGQYPQQQYPQQQYPQQYPQQPQYPQQYPQQQPPYAPAPAPSPAPAPAPVTPAPMPAPAPALPQPPLLPPPAVSANDPINTVDITWLRRRAGELIADLISALPADSQQRVAGLPLVFDNTPGEVNAFAACDKGRALMAVTDELLRISAYLAQAEATDERFASHKVDQVIQYIATHQRQNQPLATPSGGFFDSRQSADPTKTARQHQVFDEQLAFVLGHELGHHYLGHLGCTAKPDPLGAGDIARVLSGSVPLFNQPNELAADVAGTNNVLSAGARHTGGYAYTENGALLTMRFFQGLHDAAGAPMFDFEASHPSPAIRIPVIQQAAAAWRFTGGRGITLPHLGG